MNSTLRDIICDLADDTVEVLILNQPHTAAVSLDSHYIRYYIKDRGARTYEKSIYALYIVLFVLANKFSGLSIYAVIFIQMYQRDATAG